MDIIVKPVKCGDCSILSGKSEKLLIDCGSDNSYKGLCSSEFAFSVILEEIKNKEITDIMISHFHKDHFNGVLKIPNTYRFKTAYLPYSIIEGKIIYSEGIGRLLSIAPSRSWGFRLSNNILDLFRKLEKVSSTIRFVKKDDRIPFDGDQIRVLWPEVETTQFNYGDLPVKKTLENTRIGSDTFTSNKQGELTDSFKNTEIELTQQFSQIVGTGNQDLMASMENFLERFEIYVRYLHENTNENRDFNFSFINESYSELYRQRGIFRSNLDDEKLHIIKIFSHQQYQSLVTTMNAISIVCDCKERFIFLGDAPDNVINHISSSLVKQYGFVKIQHHGTERNFTFKTPRGNYNLISNGGYVNRKVSDNFVGFEKVICTNAHENPKRFCAYYNNYGVCASGCIQVGLSYKVTI